MVGQIDGGKNRNETETDKWDVTHGAWKRYFVPNNADWWAPLYPPDNFKRPTGPLCDGCHSVNYDIATKTVSEWERRLRKVSRSRQRPH